MVGMTLYRYLKIRGLRTEYPDDMRLLKAISIKRDQEMSAEKELIYKVRLTRAQLDALRTEHPELNFTRPGYAGKGIQNGD